jgi:uncharacterized membrane protein
VGSFGADLLCVVIVPAVVTAQLHQLVHARLPHNYFIYFFVTVFVGSALAYNLGDVLQVLAVARRQHHGADARRAAPPAPSP